MSNLTNNDYRKIQAWLKTNAVKDTELETAKTVFNSDITTVVQEGKNKKITLKDLKKFIAVGTIIKTTLAEYNTLSAKEENHIYLITDTSQLIVDGKAYGFSKEYEKKLSDIAEWYEAATSEDKDNIINKWYEIVDFLEGISDERKLTAIIDVFDKEISNIKEGKTIAGKARQDALGNVIHEFYAAKKDIPGFEDYAAKLTLGYPIRWNVQTKVLGLIKSSLQENTLGVVAIDEGDKFICVGTYSTSSLQEDGSIGCFITAYNYYTHLKYFLESGNYSIVEDNTFPIKAVNFLSGVINLQNESDVKAKQKLLNNTNEVIYCLIGDDEGILPSTKKAIHVPNNIVRVLQYSSPNSAVTTAISIALNFANINIPSTGVNVGDIIALTRVKFRVKDLEDFIGVELPSFTGEVEMYQYKILSVNDAKAKGFEKVPSGVMGLMSPEDKELVSKIPSIEKATNDALPKVERLPSLWNNNMNNCLETGVYPWCTLGRPEGSKGAYTCLVVKTSSDDGSYHTIEQTAYGRQDELGKIYKRIIFYKNDGTDIQYGKWISISDFPYVQELENQMQPITQSEYDTLVAEGKVENRLYFIIED